MTKNSIPFCLPTIGKEEKKAVLDVLDSGWITTGPKTQEFEKQFAKFVGAKYAVAVNSCTSAIHASLAAAEIGRGDEVITSSLTCTATVNPIIHLGAKPVFADINPRTFNIDPAKIEEKITSKTKAIIPVHFAGQPCEMDKINKIAREYGLTVIEDAAHAIGAEYHHKRIGSISPFSCFSFYATKNITTGEGGMITTNNKKLARQLKIIGYLGIEKNAWKRKKEGSWFFEVVYPGYKYNLSDILAAIGIEQLKKAKNFREKRTKIAEFFNKEFEGTDFIETPSVIKGVKPSWHIYCILLNKLNRNQFIKSLFNEGIATSVHFPPIHLQPFYRKLFGKKDKLPNTENVYKRIVSLPIYPRLTAKEAGRLTQIIKRSSL